MKETKITCDTCKKDISPLLFEIGRPVRIGVRIEHVVHQVEYDFCSGQCLYELFKESWRTCEQNTM